LANSGGSASAALTVTITGPAFTLLADTCTGISLGPRKSCTVTVDYTPGAGGGTDAGTLTAVGVKTAAVASLKLSGTVPDIVSMTSPGNQTSTVGGTVSLQMTATDSARVQTLPAWSAHGLPDGLAISPLTGLISGSPTAAGSFIVEVVAIDNAGGVDSTTFTWTINPAVNTVTVTSPGDQVSTVGVAVSLPVIATDSAAEAITYSATGLPPGVSIDSHSGLITGTPATAGTTSVTITAVDATAATGLTSFTWTVGVTVSATITGAPNTGCGACAVITIDATGLSGSGENTCGSADSCSLWVHTGYSVDVSLVSPVVGPFTYTCGGSASQNAAGPNPQGDYTGACQATVTGDYNVTASF
jgi:hypothetical protein